MENIEEITRNPLETFNLDIKKIENVETLSKTQKKHFFHKLKEKKKTISITGILTITGLFNTPQSIKTTTMDQIWKLENRNVYHTQNTLIQMKALREYISLKNPNFQVGEMDHFIITILKESKNLKLPDSATINNKKIDPLIFLLAIIETESSFNKNAISISNARGYMQIMPETAMWIKNKELLNVSLNEIHSTEINIMLGVKYLNYLSQQFHDIKWICLAYNAGEANIKRGYYNLNYWIKIQKFYMEIEIFIKKYSMVKLEG